MRYKELLEDKMSDLDLENYLAKSPKFWREYLGQFPETLQREFADEVGNDENYMKDWIKFKLASKSPIDANVKELLKLKDNREIIQRTPEDVVNHINKTWNIDIKPGKVYDPNPDRYFKYAKMPASTAKPSIMFNGEIYWGCGRFVAALIRGDNTIKVWDLRS